MSDTPSVETYTVFLPATRVRTRGTVYSSYAATYRGAQRILGNTLWSKEILFFRRKTFRRGQSRYETLVHAYSFEEDALVDVFVVVV